MEKESNISLVGLYVWETKAQSVGVKQFLLALKNVAQRSERVDIKRACDLKLTRRKHTPLYEKDTKQTQNKPMETTLCSFCRVK